MSIPKAELKKFGKLVAESFLEGKVLADLQGLTQDHIDAFIIPVMTEVEDLANGFVANKVRESFEAEPLDEHDEWWTSRR
uniref:Uncharacterized protein n=1 Tax=viral metagenome TaxID=1070528 RepID=A0A6M3JZR8_9ZZZZ